MRKLTFFLILVMLVAGALRAPAQRAGRLPFEKKKIALNSPSSYRNRFARIDPKTGQEIYYDHKPRILLLDARSGKYALKWIGFDGKDKAVYYQRPDAIDAVVSASVSRMADGRYLYRYNVQNLPSSGQALSAFALQYFAQDIRPRRVDGVYVGQMSQNREMKDGRWIDFGMLPTLRPAVLPGRKIELELESPIPPGLVECRVAGGRQGIEVAGEDPPDDLLHLLPGYEAWPKGYTIGPVDYVKHSSTEYANYLGERLYLFRKLGWVSATAGGWYEQNLRSNKVVELFKRADQDFKTGNITSEFYNLIQSMQVGR
jgi:hypothetical protein